METFTTTVEIGDHNGRRFVQVDALVDAGATFTKVPRTVLESLDIQVDRHIPPCWPTAATCPGSRAGSPSGWRAGNSPRPSRSASRANRSYWGPWP